MAKCEVRKLDSLCIIVLHGQSLLKGTLYKCTFYVHILYSSRLALNIGHFLSLGVLMVRVVIFCLTIQLVMVKEKSIIYLLLYQVDVSTLLQMHA